MRRFNPRARVGRDTKKYGILSAQIVVSIHAPAWGATCNVTDKVCNSYVSIHAPAWGATFFWRIWCCVEQVSIHAPAWGATLPTIYRFEVRNVSIHAPAWGATGKRILQLLRSRSFNPRARVGRDESNGWRVGKSPMFQSTRPRGARHHSSDIL